MHSKANDDEVVKLKGSQTVKGAKTFSVVPKTSQNPVGPNDLVRKEYIDEQISDIDTSISNINNEVDNINDTVSNINEVPVPVSAGRSLISGTDGEYQ